MLLAIIFGIIAGVDLAHISSNISQTATNTTPETWHCCSRYAVVEHDAPPTVTLIASPGEV